MQSLTLFITMIMLSFPVYAVQTTGKKEVEQLSFAEKRQNKARAIMDDNFKNTRHSRLKTAKKRNFGFQKNADNSFQTF